MRNIELGLRLAEWDLPSIIAMFCSNIDKHRSFDKAFLETRIRLLVNFEDHVNECGNALQVAYTLACMEYKSVGAHVDPAHPTKHIQRFAQLIKENETLFEIRNNEYNTNRCRKIINRLGVVRLSEHEQWALVDPEVRETIDFVCPEEDDEKGFPEKKRRGKRGKNKPMREKYLTPIGPQFDFDAPTVTLSYEHARVASHLPTNPLLNALVQPMLGMVLKDHVIEFCWSGDVARYSKMNIHVFGAPPNSYETTEDDEEDGSAVEGDFARFVWAGDVGRMVEMRDRE